MAPDSNSVDAEHVDDIVDVVVPLKDVEDDDVSQGEQQDEQQDEQEEDEDQEEALPVVSILPQEQLQERRLEDVRRVRDEAESLRHEICNLRTRLEEVEEESKFHAAKANELQELLVNSHSTSGNSGIDDIILKQADQLARKTCQIEALEKKITEITIQKTMLEVERDEAKKESLELSHVVRSLQNVTKSSMERSIRSHDKSDDDSSSESEDSDDESEDSEEIVLTPESALDLTLGNLKEHIEMLEDGLQASSTLNTEQKMNINHLENDIKAQQAQISILEGLFRELNAANQLHFHKEQEEKDAKKKKEKSKGESVESKTPSTSSPSSPKASSSPSTEAKERTLKKLGLAFRGIRMPSMPSMPARKEKALDIPEEAAAAAQAAAYLLGDIQADSAPPKDSDATNHNDTANAKKKKEKKTAMKKVKIRFKKAGLEGTYTGPLVDKKPHGVGTIRFTNGNTYLGEMRKGKMSGSGTLYTKNNGVFRGLFENNQFVGESPLNSSSNHSSNHDENSNPNQDTASSNGSSHSRSSCNGSDPAADGTEKPCDATATTANTEAHEEDDEAKANAVAALELDAFSPSNICEAPIDDSFNMVNLEGMERKTERDELRKLEEQEENESFLREFSGSEHSSSLRNELLDASMSSDESPIPGEPDPHEVF